MCSSLYLIPLPLYGSGGLTLRMLAANSPTNCLSIPLIIKLVLLGASALSPSGTSISTGCE